MEFSEFALSKICKPTRSSIEKMNTLDQALLNGKEKRNILFDFLDRFYFKF